MIINIVINIKKISGGNTILLCKSDFALEPSENLNLSLLRTYFADFVGFKRVQLDHFSR